MFNSSKCLVGIMASLLLTSSAVLAAEKPPSSQLEKLSYSLGVKAGENFLHNDVVINQQQFSRGLADALNKQALQMTDQEMENTLQEFQKQHISKVESQQKKMANENLIKSKDFLSANKKQPGVKTTPSGLQYIEIIAGKGSAPKPGDAVTVNYRGTLIDGTEFDSSYRRNEAVTFPLGNVIPGWEEALLMMKPGAKWKVFIPPSLAYGDKGAGQLIQPNSALIFEIELISVKPKS